MVNEDVYFDIYVSCLQGSEREGDVLDLFSIIKVFSREDESEMDRPRLRHLKRDPSKIRRDRSNHRLNEIEDLNVFFNEAHEGDQSSRGY